MPAESIAQRRFMAACEHGAGWANCPKMTHQQFHDFASTKESSLPYHAKKNKNYARGTANVQLGDTPPLPSSVYGSDIVPAALTPKEMVLTPAQQTEVMPIPGAKKHLLPSQIKKLAAMRGKSMPVAKVPKGMPKLPRLQFRFGGEVGDTMGGGWRRFVDNGGHFNFQGASSSQDAVDPTDPTIEPPPLPSNTDDGPPSTIGNPSNPRLGREFYDHIVDNPVANRLLQFNTGFGLSPSFGSPAFGPTVQPTYWINYPGVGNVPMAIPVGGWNNDGGPPALQVSRHTPQPKPD